MFTIVGSYRKGNHVKTPRCYITRQKPDFNFINRDDEPCLSVGFISKPQKFQAYCTMNESTNFHHIILQPLFIST